MQKEAQICDMNIAHALTRGMGWGSCEPPEPADEGKGVKPSLNAGSSRLQSWSSSLWLKFFKLSKRRENK
ncbi:MAG: hypothetical protein HA489_07705 [Archaeoglobales archaeon]|nr:hypothetical protein [Archaeoglobales archaeon]